jgi:hypothetical protein
MDGLFPIRVTGAPHVPARARSGPPLLDWYSPVARRLRDALRTSQPRGRSAPPFPPVRPPAAPFSALVT